MVDQSHKKKIPQMPHIGKLYQDFIRKKRYPQVWVAKYMGKNESVVTRYRHRPSLQCYLLWELSHILKHNFFLDLAAQLPSNFTTHAPDPTLALQERVKELEEEVNTLRIQKETLEGILKK
ncbi:MAG: hypothetical protein CMC14_05305 [Flavobacteriaceae bacterium]|nr:hypothetical protein [Flavobacteriaceae bacterium]|tara:strand:- start:392 stop:754 length:363 start_codon:yes stop_codon:yes gene_type:complete